MCGNNETVNNGKGLSSPYDEICKGSCRICQSIYEKKLKVVGKSQLI